MSSNSAEVIKDICGTKADSTVDHSTVTSWFKKILLWLQEPWLSSRSGRPKIKDSEAMLQDIEANLVSNIWRVSGGARGVMVIVVGSGHGDTSSNPGRD